MAEPDVKAPGGKGTVKIFGQAVSKKTLMVAGVVAGGVLAYAYYRKSKSSSSASTAAGTGTADTTAAGNIDPVTGYPYGSAEDTAALAAQQDSGLDTNAGSDIDPETGYPYDSSQDLAALGYTDTGTGTGTGGGGGSVSSVTTNAQWEQECIANLQAGGVAQSVVSDAESGLPRYLAKLSLSGGQATAVQMAVGLTGPPPVGGPYNIVPAPAAPTPPKSPAKGPVTVPSLVSDRVDDANSALKSLGLKASIPHRAAGKAYWVTATSPKAGSKVAAGSTVKLSISDKAPKA